MNTLSQGLQWLPPIFETNSLELSSSLFNSNITHLMFYPQTHPLASTAYWELGGQSKGTPNGPVICISCLAIDGMCLQGKSTVCVAFSWYLLVFLTSHKEKVKSTLKSKKAQRKKTI